MLIEHQVILRGESFTWPLTENRVFIKIPELILQNLIKPESLRDKKQTTWIDNNSCRGQVCYKSLQVKSTQIYIHSFLYLLIAIMEC